MSVVASKSYKEKKKEMTELRKLLQLNFLLLKKKLDPQDKLERNFWFET